MKTHNAISKLLSEELAKKKRAYFALFSVPWSSIGCFSVRDHRKPRPLIAHIDQLSASIGTERI
jgi:hypothetical protein